jgi:hypothetical protein
MQAGTVRIVYDERKAYREVTEDRQAGWQG